MYSVAIPSSFVRLIKLTEVEINQWNMSTRQSVSSRSSINSKSEGNTQLGNDLKCVVCKTQFSTKQNLIKHFHTHTGEKPFRCLKCKVFFRHQGTLKLHTLYKHSKNKKELCSECTIAFDQGKQSKCEQGCGVKCPVCFKVFPCKLVLKPHMRYHSKLSYNCLFCAKTFSCKTSFMNHTYVHTREKPFSCKICQKPFQTKRERMLHQLVHTKKKEHRCPECPAAFGIKFRLQHHIRSVHRNIRPHKCPLCNRAFSNKSNLTTHFNVHSNEKPYKCDQCGKRFSQKCHMKEHLKRHELIIGKLWCSKCNITYPNMLVFQRHYLEDHAGINANVLQCIFCDKEFSNRKSLEKHIRAHIHERPSV